MMQDIHRERQMLAQEKVSWKLEQEIIQEKVNKSDEILQLNVGGVTQGFMVRKSVLTQVPDSALEAMFSGRHQLPLMDGKIFLDRDPQTFLTVINYLRNNMQMPSGFNQVEKELVELELKFWGVYRDYETAEYIKSFQKQVFDKPPDGEASEALIGVWNKFGPFNLPKVIEEHSLLIDPDKQIRKGVKVEGLKGIANGQVDEKGCISGFTRYHIDKDLWEGQLSNNFFNGYVRWIDSDGDIYEGNYESNHVNGFGKMIKADGTVLEGQWKNGEFQGEGSN